ncbi:MAG TPA: rhodanese-like domain-containing protein [Gammaproteobacteria bacterium]|nr:rhodanese-like domain-containing protein [Gammaproteobacteria bacterium]
MSSFLKLVLFALVSLPACASDYMSPGMTPLELQEKLLSDTAPLVVDLRAPVEFKVAHIPGAVNIPVTELEKRLDEVSGDSGVLIYCINGARTLQAEPLLYSHGIADVYHLEGSLQAWIRGNFPIEKGGPAKTSW